MIEAKIDELIAALNANTAALAGATQGTAVTVPANAAVVPGAGLTAGNVAPIAQAPAPAPAPAAVATPTPAAVVQPVAASPSSITLDQLKAEVTAKYAAMNVDPNHPDSRVFDIITRYGGSLSTVDPVQYDNLVGEVRAL